MKQKFWKPYKAEVCELTLIYLVGIPKLYWFGTEGDYNIMAMDFLG